MEHYLVDSDCESLASRVGFPPHYRAGDLAEVDNKSVGGLAARAGPTLAV